MKAIEISINLKNYGITFCFNTEIHEAYEITVNNDLMDTILNSELLTANEVDSVALHSLFDICTIDDRKETKGFVQIDSIYYVIL